MQEITAIITGMNERSEVENTLKSIRETAYNIDILYIDDCSDNDYDYKGVCEKYNCKYIRLDDRKGVAESRNYGVSLCETPYFVILDSHMRFYDKGWDERLLSYLKKYPKSIICTRTAIMKKNNDGTITGEDGSTRSNAIGGYLDKTKEGYWFSVKWSYHYYEDKEEHLKSIPCVLGAVYASNVEWWNHIGGINGLIKWGSDEPMMSVKTWLAGGECLCIDDMYVGHLYRDSNPNPVDKKEIERNELFVGHFFLTDEDDILKFEASMAKRLGVERFNEVKKLFDETKGSFEEDKKEFHDNVNVMGLEYFNRINDEVIMKGDSKYKPSYKSSGPKFSVVMPVYNGEKYIKEAIDSVLGQTYGNFELIIVNDGSTDGTEDIVKSYNDKRIRLFNRNHTGVANSLNYGIKMAKGELMARFDADDIMYPDRLDFQRRFMNYHTVIDIAGMGMRWSLGEPGNEFFKPANKEVTWKDFIEGNPMSHPTVVMRRESLNTLPFIYEPYYVCEDLRLWLHAMKHGLRIATFEKPVIVYRQHPEQITADYDKVMKDSERVRRSFFYNDGGNITCILTGYNENGEIERTISSIRATADRVKILFVDDASDDNVNYESICKAYNVDYIRNGTRLGEEKSILVGLENTTTKYFCALPAHSRIVNDKWDLSLENNISEQPHKLLYAKPFVITLTDDGDYINENGEEDNQKASYNSGWFYAGATEMWKKKFRMYTPETAPLMIKTDDFKFGTVKFW